MSEPRLTRIAPTPSGFLHLGNAVNFALISLLADRWDAGIYLRIDDMDADRARPEYVDDIFDVLAWIDIPSLAGASDRADFEANFTMTARTDYYRSQLDLLNDHGLEVFACACSRVDLAAAGGLRCAGDCATRGLELEKGSTALRLRIPEGTSVRMHDRTVDLAAEHGDVVLWRRDDLPAYHLVTVIEDRDLEVTDIVRGEDLVESSALHVWLARYLDAPTLVQARWWHHPLVTDESGAKLSKSQLDAGPMVLTEALRTQVFSRAESLAAALGA
ncbi:MAG: hypothetical protein RL205_1606 [Actinomycetota bacterium]|jgi:glutamyl-tRNA synthetase